jgi:hypothetical protein
MSLQGPLLVVAENPAAELVDGLVASGAFPVLTTPWREAAAALAEIQPAAVLLAEPEFVPPPKTVQAFRRAIDQATPIVPVIVRVCADTSPQLDSALPIAADASLGRLVGRLRSALRVRTLHATALRRAETLAAQDRAPEWPKGDPLDDATVLVVGRGRSYPSLSVAVGERVGLIGALSVEAAARHLNARDIDGVVIGDGFSPRIIEAFLTVMTEDVRFRDLPVVVAGGLFHALDHGNLTNVETVAGVAERVTERLLPLVRLHAFEARLKRLLKSFDSEGMIDPLCGLLTPEAFWRDLGKAVHDAGRLGNGLSVARFSFEGRLEPRVGIDAARLVGRLMRNVDFACREMDGSIIAVFTETDLRSAHVIARRIASVLKHTTLRPGSATLGVDPTVTLATCKSTDTLDTLMARVDAARAVAVG